MRELVETNRLTIDKYEEPDSSDPLTDMNPGRPMNRKDRRRHDAEKRRARKKKHKANLIDSKRMRALHDAP